MSINEILVIVFGLFLGYWVVSKLFADSPAAASTAGKDAEPQQPTAGADAASRPWHEVLNVPANASADAIRQSYKELMQQYHPDKVAALGEELRALAERKSKEINAAYTEAMRLRGDSV